MADDVYCNRCGHRNPVASNFCSSCGAPLEGQREDATTVAYTPEAVEAAAETAVHHEPVPPGLGYLVVKRGPNVGSRFALDADVIQAGRHPQSHIFLDDITVSRRHVEIVRQADGRYVVRDVGSLNGTYLNRERVEAAELSDGDELQIGTFKLVFLTGSGGAP